MSTKFNMHVSADADQNDTIRMTDSAALKVYELIQEENNPNLKLRVFITGGGCSGFQYGFSFDEQANEDDFEIVKEVMVEVDNVNS